MRGTLLGAVSVSCFILAGCDSGPSHGGSSSDPFSQGGTFGGGNANGHAGAGGSLFPDMLKPGSAGSSSSGGSGQAPGDQCGLMQFGLDKLPGEMLLVLDRSGSMRETPPMTNATKWVAVTNAIDQVVMMTQSSVSWGLKMFPMMSQCGSDGAPSVGVGVNQYTQIMAAIRGNAPVSNGSTPTRGAMESATAYLKTVTTPNPKFILLATDGKPNCLNGMTSGANEDVPGATKAVGDAFAAGFPVFVLGIAVDAATSTVLNDFADKGGRPRAGAVKFYPAANQADLVAAMAEIAGKVASCTLTLNNVPPSPNDVAVDADAMRVPRDQAHQNGWDYGAGNKSVEVYGSWCDKLKNGTIKNVQITFGCPGKPIP